MTKLVLAIDQGTTGTTVVVYEPTGRPLGKGYSEHPQSFPQPSWVEHDAMEIWRTVQSCTAKALAAAGVSAQAISAVGITNQRETIVCWDAKTGEPVGPTIVWQDRRTEPRCEELREAGHGPLIRKLTGLPIDPYFSATKIEWLLNNVPSVQEAASSGRIRLGTIDSWIAFKASAGRAHITDASNASRTMLCDTKVGAWSDELCELFGVDRSWLPTIVDSSGELAQTEASELVGISAPISGIAGDQQSALFGQACFSPGMAKATYGTGAFVLVNAGDEAPPTTEALLATAAWRLQGEHLNFALEGSVFTAGATIQWLRDGLKIIESAKDIEALAQSVDNSGGVMLVPAFAGLGAPFWDANARASIMGLTRGSERGHIARAALEAIAFRVRQNVEAMAAEGCEVHELRVDGGMALNDTFLQVQADVLNIPVTRPTNIETTSLGAAYLASLGAGLAQSASDLASSWDVGRVFEPRASEHEALTESFARFERAAEATRSVRS